MKVASILGALEVLPSSGTYAVSHKSRLAGQNADSYATSSEKPNILFIFTDDQGDSVALDCDQTMLNRVRLTPEFYGLHAHC